MIIKAPALLVTEQRITSGGQIVVCRENKGLVALVIAAKRLGPGAAMGARNG